MLSTAVVILACVGIVQATPIEVGSGDNTAGLYIEWKDGFSMKFLVSFPEESITGMELIQRVADATPLTIVVNDFGFGRFVDGIAWEEHANAGWGGGEDWWHYWTKEGGHNWASSMIGASDRVVVDGAWDGWVYGRAGIPEPATLLLVGLGVMFVRRQAAR